VENPVSSLCFFKFTLYRYSWEKFMRLLERRDPNRSKVTAVGLCRLNQVDPYPRTYSLSNP
jgi:hypothetical protein